MFYKYFPNCKTFNINLNTFIPLSVFRLKDELLLGKSFKHLLKYHMNNYISKIKKYKNSMVGITFIDYLREIIKTKRISQEEIESKIENTKIISDEEFIKIINDLKKEKEFIGEDINYGISEDNFNQSEDNEDNIIKYEFEENNQDNNNIDIVNPVNIIKILYVFQKENILIPPMSKDNCELMEYFKIKKKPKEKLKFEEIYEKNEMPAQVKFNDEMIADVIKLIENIQNSKFVGDEIKNILKKLYLAVKYLKIYNVIFIPFLGPSNAGKSSMINAIIGKDILPTKSEECTKRGIIIRYCDDGEDEITLRKAIFKKEMCLGKENYCFGPDNLIMAKGLNKVKETLEGLNYEYNIKEEDSFYYIKTKIKLFDDMKLDNYFKQIIYLIDFPGYGTENNLQKELYKKVMRICNSFIFIIKNSLIKVDTDQNFINELLDDIMKQKHKLLSGIIQSCLFVINNEKSLQTTKNDLFNVIDDIKSIIKGINEKDINACFFNPIFYMNYLESFNYFYNITESIQDEYNNYCEYKYHNFTIPEIFNPKVYKTFAEYLYKSLNDRTNKLGFKIKLEKNIDVKITNEINEIITELEDYEKIGRNEFTQKLRCTISSTFNFARKNLINLQKYKESNIENFKSTFLNQINKINNNMQNELKNKIFEVIKTLNYFFNSDFSERKKDLKVFEEFKININKIKRQIELSLKESKKFIEWMEQNYYFDTEIFLKKNKDTLPIALQKKDYEQIKNEIGNELESKVEMLNIEIQNFFNIIENAKILYEDAKNIIRDFTDGKNNLDDCPNFEEFFSGEVSKSGSVVCDEIKKYIKDCINETKTKIWNEKKIFSFLFSCIWDIPYLTNIIDIIKDLFIKKTEYIFDLLKRGTKEYFNKIINSIKTTTYIIEIRYTETQEIKWEQLCNNYIEIKKNINDSLEKLCKS